MAVNYGQTFTAATTWSVPAATHGLGHRGLRVQCWDASTPRQRVYGQVTVDVSSNLTVAYQQAQSGLLVANGAAPLTSGLEGNQSFAFAASLTWTVPGSLHGFATDRLLLDVYDASTPSRWLPFADVRVHPTTFDITVAWLQPQAGRIVVCAHAATGTPNSRIALVSNPQTILGTAHDLDTANLGLQVYDSTGREVFPATTTVDPVTFDVTVAFGQAQTGDIVLNGSETTVNLGQTFTNTATWSLTAATHGLGHRALRVQTWDAQTPRQRLSGGLTVDGSGNVTVLFAQPQSGLLVVNGAAPPSPGPLGNQEYSFASSSTWLIPGMTHGYGTDHLLVDVYDGQTPRRWLPFADVTVDPVSYDITIAWGQPQTGNVVVCAHAARGTPNTATALVSNPQTIPGTTHDLETTHLGVQIYDSTGHEVLPSSVTVDPVTFDVTVAFLQEQTGVIVLNGSTSSPPEFVLPADAGSFLVTALEVPLRLHLPALPASLILTGTAAGLRRSARLLGDSATLTLSGSAMTPRVQLPTSSGVLMLTGTAVPLRVSLPAASGLVSLTVTPGGLQIRLPVSSAVLALSGTLTGLRKGSRLPLTSGSLVLSGTLVLPRVSMAVSSATLVLSGPATGLARHARLLLTPGMVSLTGTATTLRKQARLLATPAPVALTGTETPLRVRMAVSAGIVLIVGTPQPLRIMLTASPGTLTLSGTPVTPRLRLPVSAQILFVTGTPVPLRVALAIETATVVLTGSDVELRQTTALVLPASSGLFTLTGSLVLLRALRRMVATTGSLSVNAPPALLRAHRRLAATPGTGTVTGVPIHAHVSLTATPGVGTVTGTSTPLRLYMLGHAGASVVEGADVTLLFGVEHRLIADPGSLSVTGTEVVLRVFLHVLTSPGMLLLEGTLAPLHLHMAAGSDTLSVTGLPAALHAALRLLAASEGFTLLGTPASFLLTCPVASDTTVLTGTLADLPAQRRLAGQAGALAVTGTDVTLQYSLRQVLLAETGSFTLGGTPVSMRVVLEMTPATSSLSGLDAGLSRTRRLAAASGALTLDGQPVTFNYSEVPPLITVRPGALQDPDAPSRGLRTSRGRPQRVLS